MSLKVCAYMGASSCRTMHSYFDSPSEDTDGSVLRHNYSLPCLAVAVRLR
jgi:hypothetical protein